MSDINYILSTLAEDPGRWVTLLEYACVCTLLMALLRDSTLRRRDRDLARQKSTVQQEDKIKGK
ncbi:MAG TPA: hypothetical protein VFB72_09755 [Verrucomicrobiae bacterium]|nr:hypothetical protein [Verrucomicrobiae bacterium]